MNASAINSTNTVLIENESVLLNSNAETSETNPSDQIKSLSPDQKKFSENIELLKDSRKISGKVIDTKGSPLTGASVQIKVVAKGTITDINGTYEIYVEDNNTVLIFSFSGFQSKEVAVGELSTIDVVLEEDFQEIDEVVVTALGITKKAKSLVYAIEKVDVEGLKMIKDPNNVLNSLQGKVSNALITQSSGGVGSSARIVLRGNNSLQGSNSPLIVVDGVPIFNSIYDNGANNINPDDIASITVFRGPSAAVLYGSRAGNGVVLITTNQGSKDRVSVEVNNGVTFDRPFVLPDFQNKYGQGNYGTLSSSAGDSWGALMEGQDYVSYLGDSAQYSAQPDNVRDFFNDGVNISTSVSISGGNEKNQVYYSYSNTETQGIIPNNELSRNGFTLRGTTAITDKFSIDSKINYFKQTREFMPRTGEGNTAVMDIYQIPRNVSTSMAEQYAVKKELGIPTPNVWPSTDCSVYGNPYWVVNYDCRDESRDQITGFVTLKYQLTHWLNLSARYNLERSIRTYENSVLEGTLLYGEDEGGNYTERNSEYTQQWGNLMFDGQNSIGDKISVNYQAGTIKDIYSETEANGLSLFNKFNIISIFGTANMAFDNYLFIEGSIRNDWDSRLPESNSFTYYSAGVSAILSSAFELPSAIPFLKVNLNYAEVGNGDWFEFFKSSYLYDVGINIGDLSYGFIYLFPNLKPEIVRSLEASVDGKFFSNRLGFMATAYKSNSFNQLIFIKMSSSSGYYGRYINAGTIRNVGLELGLTATPIKKKDFIWDIGVNYSMNRNEVISLNDDLGEISTGNMNFGAQNSISAGGSIGDLSAYTWATDDNGNYLVSSSGVPITTASLAELPELIGNFNPKGIFGITNNFTIKRFTVNVLITGRIGGVMVSGTEMNLAYSGITKATEEYRDGDWVLGGVDTDGNAVETGTSAQRFWQTVSYKRYGYAGDVFAYDVTNARVKQFSIGYNIPVKPTSFIKRATISLVANNLFWLYRGESILDIPGLEKRKFWFDPDVSMYNENYQGVEYGAFPSTRSIGYNLSIKF